MNRTMRKHGPADVAGSAGTSSKVLPALRQGLAAALVCLSGLVLRRDRFEDRPLHSRCGVGLPSTVHSAHQG